FQFGRVLVANGQPKGAGRLQDPLNRPAPRPRPVEVLLGVGAVVVDVVVIANVERRVGEDQVHRSRVELLKSLNAISLIKSIWLHSGLPRGEVMAPAETPTAARTVTPTLQMGMYMRQARMGRTAAAARSAGGEDAGW